ncbi:MAG: hypothetical protein GY865_18130 [candidate division Zixibacteria bacterium]|nr:hypothetical protein [candidate division Zixibacteria bacterium]
MKNKLEEFRAPRELTHRAIQDISDKMNELIRAVNQIPEGETSTQTTGKTGDIQLVEKGDKSRVARFKFANGYYETPTLTFVEK